MNSKLWLFALAFYLIGAFAGVSATIVYVAGIGTPEKRLHATWSIVTLIGVYLISLALCMAFDISVFSL